MVITCLRLELKEAINIIERFCGKNINLPIISNILLEARNGSLIIKATNLEIGVSTTIPTKVIKEGRIILPPRILSSILQTISDEVVIIKEKQNIITIETETTTSEINTINPSDFPIIPTLTSKEYLLIPNTDFKTALNRIIPTVNISEFKPEISGIYFWIDKKDLIIAGTDTFRLAEQRLKKFSSHPDNLHIIIPLRVMQETLRLLPEDGETEIKFNAEQILITIKNTQLITRFISGTYPDYRGLIPKEYGTTLRLERESFLAGVRLSGVFASKLNDVVLSYRSSQILVEISNPEVGKHTREVGGDVEGKPGRVGFNYRYLSDAVEAVASKRVTIGIQDETRPARVWSEEDPSFFTIVMPLRV